MRGASFPLAVVLCAAALTSLLLGLGGWFSPGVFPDTHGYLAAPTLTQPFGSFRHPLYGAIVRLLEPVGGTALMPALQWSVLVAAALALTAAAQIAGLSRRAAVSLGLATLLNQAVLLWARGILPEALAIAAMLFAFSGVLVLAVRPRAFWWLAPAIGLVTGFAYTLRPIGLPAVAMLPLLLVLLSRALGGPARIGRAAVLAVLVALPFLGQSLYRQQTVGDFGLVSFGGFGVSGMTSQMLTPEIIARLPAAFRPDAEAIMAARERAIASGAAAPLPRNSRGEASFTTAALDGFDGLARNYDQIMWREVITMQGANESWVAFNARLGGVNGAIIRHAPDRWLFWMAGGASRLVGKLFIYNVTFLLALGAFAVVALWRLLRDGRIAAETTGTTSPEWTVLTLLVVAWIVTQTALAVVATFPALRYIDVGGMLMAALPLYGLLRLLSVPRASGNTSHDAPR